MFHSIYGTEKFQGFKLPLERRGEVRALIGERAERLAYVNCAMDRASFDRALETAEGPYQIGDRITGETIEVSGADFDDLCRVHLIDWLEQVPRSEEWDYRRAGYEKMARRLGEVKAEQRHEAGFTAGAEIAMRSRRSRAFPVGECFHVVATWRRWSTSLRPMCRRR